MANLEFVHLHVHSSYSLLEGALPIGRLAELAKADKQPALALTDTDNMFGALEFSEKLASSGIQPIVGCALAVDFADTDHAMRGTVQAQHPRIVLLATREAGYRRICLDTLPSMTEATALYWAVDFRPIAPYYATPIAGTLFMGRKLVPNSDGA